MLEMPPRCFGGRQVAVHLDGDEGLRIDDHGPIVRA